MKETGDRGHLESELWSCGEVCLGWEETRFKKMAEAVEGPRVGKRSKESQGLSALEALKGFAQVEIQGVSQGSGDSILG